MSESCGKCTEKLDGHYSKIDIETFRLSIPLMAQPSGLAGDIFLAKQIRLPKRLKILSEKMKWAESSGPFTLLRTCRILAGRMKI